MERSVIAAQCASIVHRGPDDEGILVDADCGIGMRRLAVVDLAGGRQPMSTADGRFALVFNGEIYNHHDLRRELQAAGRCFRTRSSDTEVILEGFATWGPAVWRRLSGMFACAVWDRVERTLHLARDPVGIKPLYWTEQAGGVAFASELKALAAVPDLRFVPDPDAIDEFLAYGAVLGPGSIYRGVSRLEPGVSLAVPAEGCPVPTRYWNFTAEPRQGLDLQAWLGETRRRLLSAVGSHLESDVPLGAFLSGGVDSAAVVAAMARQLDRPVTAFTIGFEDPCHDETAAAARVAAHLGCTHVVQRLCAENAAAVLPALAAAFDEPFADPSAVPTWYVSRLARERVTVALSGDGGDELFAGYARHRTERIRAPLNRIPGALPIAALGSRLWPPLPCATWMSMRERWRKVASDALPHQPSARYAAKQVLLGVGMRAHLYLPEFATTVGQPAESRLAARVPPGNDGLSAFLHADLTVWLPEVLLTKVDRASMDRSLEVRVPLLDRHFLEWTATVPTGLKQRAGKGKWLLRQAVAPWLPPGAVAGGKRGFSPPLSAWIRGDLGAAARAWWHDSGLAQAGMFDPTVVERLFNEHRYRDQSRSIYVLAMLSLWWQHQRQVFALPAKTRSITTPSVRMPVTTSTAK